MRAVTPESGLPVWGQLLRVALDVERAVNHVVGRATLEATRLVEPLPPPVPRDPDDEIIRANREIVELFDELDREAAVL